MFRPQIQKTHCFIVFYWSFWCRFENNTNEKILSYRRPQQITRIPFCSKTYLFVTTGRRAKSNIQKRPWKKEGPKQTPNRQQQYHWRNKPEDQSQTHRKKEKTEQTGKQHAIRKEWQGKRKADKTQKQVNTRKNAVEWNDREWQGASWRQKDKRQDEHPTTLKIHICGYIDLPMYL